MALSFDCFGTLVTVDQPARPWTAVADELRDRGVSVPTGWQEAYRQSHRDYDPSAEAPLDEHVRLALASLDVEAAPGTIREAVLEAFDVPVGIRLGAREALAAAREVGPVAVCSNCSVPGLVQRTLERADLEVDYIVTSVDCGRRKPHARPFEATAEGLSVPIADLVHVGDDPRADGGAERAGATFVDVAEVPLPALAERLREGLIC